MYYDRRIKVELSHWKKALERGVLTRKIYKKLKIMAFVIFLGTFLAEQSWKCYCCIVVSLLVFSEHPPNKTFRTLTHSTLTSDITIRNLEICAHSTKLTAEQLTTSTTSEQSRYCCSFLKSDKNWLFNWFDNMKLLESYHLIIVLRNSIESSRWQFASKSVNLSWTKWTLMAIMKFMPWNRQSIIDALFEQFGRW